VVAGVDQLGDRLTGALLGDQALAHEDRVGSGRGVPDQVVWTAHAGFGNLDDAAGQAGRDPLEHRSVDLQGTQVTGVDPDHLRAGLQRAVGLFLVVHLDQGGHAQRLDPLQQAHQDVLLECGDDQQNQVGAVRTGLVDLIAGDHEVLTQHRHGDRGTDGRQVVQRTAEPAPLGQHADRTGPTGRVVDREVSRIGDLGQPALGRRRTLHLGDHGHAGLAQRRVRVHRRRRRRCQFTDPLQRNLLLASGDVFTHAGQNLVEHAYGRCLAGLVTLRVRTLSSHERTPLSGRHGPMLGAADRRRMPGVWRCSRKGLRHNGRLAVKGLSRSATSGIDHRHAVWSLAAAVRPGRPIDHATSFRSAPDGSDANRCCEQAQGRTDGAWSRPRRDS